MHIWIFTEMKVSLQLWSRVWYSTNMLHLLIFSQITEVLISLFSLLKSVLLILNILPELRREFLSSM